MLTKLRPDSLDIYALIKKKTEAFLLKLERQKTFSKIDALVWVLVQNKMNFLRIHESNIRSEIRRSNVN